MKLYFKIYIFYAAAALFMLSFIGAGLVGSGLGLSRLGGMGDAKDLGSLIQFIGIPAALTIFALKADGKNKLLEQICLGAFGFFSLLGTVSYVLYIAGNDSGYDVFDETKNISFLFVIALFCILLACAGFILQYFFRNYEFPRKFTLICSIAGITIHGLFLLIYILGAFMAENAQGLEDLNQPAIIISLFLEALFVLNFTAILLLSGNVYKNGALE